MDWLILGSVIFFVAAMLLVGIIVSKKVNDADDSSPADVKHLNS